MIKIEFCNKVNEQQNILISIPKPLKGRDYYYMSTGFFFEGGGHV